MHLTAGGYHSHTQLIHNEDPPVPLLLRRLDDVCHNFWKTNCKKTDYTKAFQQITNQIFRGPGLQECRYRYKTLGSKYDLLDKILQKVAELKNPVILQQQQQQKKNQHQTSSCRSLIGQQHVYKTLKGFTKSSERIWLHKVCTSNHYLQEIVQNPVILSKNIFSPSDFFMHVY